MCVGAKFSSYFLPELGLIWIDVVWGGSEPKPRLPWIEAHVGASSPVGPKFTFGKTRVSVDYSLIPVDPRGRQKSPPDPWCGNPISSSRPRALPRRRLAHGAARRLLRSAASPFVAPPPPHPFQLRRLSSSAPSASPSSSRIHSGSPSSIPRFPVSMSQLACVPSSLSSYCTSSLFRFELPLL